MPWWLSRFFCRDVEGAAREAPLMESEERVARFGRQTIIEQFDSLPFEDFQQELECCFVDESYSFYSYDLILPCTRQRLQLADEFSDFPRVKGRQVAGFDVGRQRDRMPPAEEAQVDWMHVGTLDVPGGRRTVSALVIVLSYSRATWVHFSFDQQIESVLRGHIEAFEFFGGVPRKLLYDNMKTVVVERRGDAIRFHSRLYGLAQHYLFSATPCGPYRPHEKGRVERRIRDLRSSFLAALSWSSLDDLRTEFRRWQQEVLFERQHPRDNTRTVRDVFEEERKLLLDLPNHPPDAQLIKAVTLRKQPYVTFDTNRYSVPPEFVRCCLTLAVSANRVRILDGDTVIASHARSFGKKQRIDDPAHLDALAANKRKAAALRGRDRVMRMLPIAQT